MTDVLKIKVCGLVEPENIEQVCHLGPDFVGYIFYRDSKRYVGDKPDPAIFKIPPQGTRKVGVFVNEKIEEVLRVFEVLTLDLVQLHGDESPGYCHDLKQAGIPVIKAISPLKARQNRMMEEYSPGIRYFLFDTPSQQYGGTGRKFDWSLLENIAMPAPFLLSGGIGPGDEVRIKEIRQDHMFGVDISSRFECDPGVKDVTLLERFIKEIRK